MDGSRMTRKYFGTDGIRGRANAHPMTAEVALKLGMAAALQFRRGNYRHRVVIGKDTRLSGYMIEPALTSGFVSMGMDVVLVGPMPTPAVAMLTRSLRADLGVMISASHNPFEDNGIKLFGPDGYKLSDAVEFEIEAKMDGDLAADLEPAEMLGRARRLEDARGRYTEYVKQTFPRGLRLDGLRIAIDCANGAAYKVAPEVLWELGADITTIGVSPDGTNINKDCGSTNLDALQTQTIAAGADIGLALDGDADRLIVCDQNGRVIDGDQIMALIAEDWLSLIHI